MAQAAENRFVECEGHIAARGAEGVSSIIAGNGQLVSGAGGEEALRGGLGEAARGGRRDARPALHPGHGGAGAQGDTANHGDGEAIGGHGVHGHGNVFMDGGGRVTITMGPLERIAAARQGGGHAQRGGRREVRRGVQHLHGDAGPVRGQARGVHPFHGDGGPRAGHLVPHRAAPAVAAVADRERMDAKVGDLVFSLLALFLQKVSFFLHSCFLDCSLSLFVAAINDSSGRWMLSGRYCGISWGLYYPCSIQWVQDSQYCSTCYVCMRGTYMLIDDICASRQPIDRKRFFCCLVHLLLSVVVCEHRHVYGVKSAAPSQGCSILPYSSAHECRPVLLGPQLHSSYGNLDVYFPFVFIFVSNASFA